MIGCSEVVNLQTAGISNGCLNRRILLFTCFGALITAEWREGMGAEPMALPIVPLRLFADHWNHRWFIWLPRHPVYEAVEVMTRPGGSGRAVNWVFFTERAPPKQQVSYTNDPDLAKRHGWSLRDIGCTVSSFPDGPLNLSVRLKARGADVAISVGFDPNSKLSARGAGLTPQMGHDAARRILIFYRGRAALASTSSVVVNGEDVSRPIEGRPDPLPFHAAYSRNIFIGVVPFGDTTFTFGDEPGGIRFSPAPGKPVTTYVATLGPQERLELRVNSSSRLTSYAAIARGHFLSIGFDPALPPLSDAMAETSHFQLGIDDTDSLITGAVVLSASKDRGDMDWQLVTPTGAQTTRFRSKVEYRSGRTVTVKVERAAT
jgi:hypothetical protein